MFLFFSDVIGSAVLSSFLKHPSFLRLVRKNEQNAVTKKLCRGRFYVEKFGDRIYRKSRHCSNSDTQNQVPDSFLLFSRGPAMVFSLLSSLHFSPENPVPVQNKIHCRRKHPRNYGSCGNLPELSLLPGTEKTGKQRSAPVTRRLS